MIPDIDIAVLLPCYNEEKAIGAVVASFRAALPLATIYVYDNNSTDNTLIEAKKSGAIVRCEPRQGKGNVIRRMFLDIDADVYLLADGDQTYDSAAAPVLVEKLLSEQLDMVVGARVNSDTDLPTYRRGHRFGNALFTKIVDCLFGSPFKDILSGYRAFSRRFVKSFPALSRGFDTEVELTIHSLELCIPVGEVNTLYYPRPSGSESKLNKYRDGLKILRRVLLMLKETRPFFFFGVFSGLFAVVSIVLAMPIFYHFMVTGLVPRIPTAILTTGLMVLAFMSLGCGIILDSVSRGRKERQYLYYLSQAWLRK
jgi:glycosyltransferase involved in cell wall biosynthesis